MRKPFQRNLWRTVKDFKGFIAADVFVLIEISIVREFLFNDNSK